VLHKADVTFGLAIGLESGYDVTDSSHVIMSSITMGKSTGYIDSVIEVKEKQEAARY
jgi:hypothetical protein